MYGVPFTLFCTATEAISFALLAEHSSYPMEENRRLEEDEQGLDTRCDDDDDLHGVVRGRAAACALLLCARRAS